MDSDYIIENGIDEVEGSRELLSSQVKVCDDKARGQDYYKRFVFCSASRLNCLSDFRNASKSNVGYFFHSPSWVSASATGSTTVI